MNDTSKRPAVDNPRAFVAWHTRGYPLNAIPGVDWWNNLPIPLEPSDGYKAARALRFSGALWDQEGYQVIVQDPLPGNGRHAGAPNRWPEYGSERDEPGRHAGPEPATQYEVDRQAARNMGGNYADAWRYFERLGYDMREVEGQYRDL